MAAMGGGAFERPFGPGKNLNTTFSKFACSGYCLGGTLKLRLDWYINYIRLVNLIFQESEIKAIISVDVKFAHTSSRSSQLCSQFTNNGASLINEVSLQKHSRNIRETLDVSVLYENLTNRNTRETHEESVPYYLKFWLHVNLAI